MACAITLAVFLRQTDHARDPEDQPVYWGWIVYAVCTWIAAGAVLYRTTIKGCGGRNNRRVQPEVLPEDK